MQLHAKYAAGVILRRDVNYFVEREHSTLVFVSDRLFKLKVGAAERILHALELLRGGTTLDAFNAILPEHLGTKLLMLLETARLLRVAYVNQFRGTAQECHVDYLSVYAADPNQAQKAIQAASVCILGCGAVGACALQLLLGAGVRRLHLIDPDRVEVTNFNRQFIPRWQQQGELKVSVLKDYVHASTPDATVTACARRVLSADDLASAIGPELPTIVISCADTPPVTIRVAVTSYCQQQRVACTFAGVGVEFGLVGPLLCAAPHWENYLARLQRRSSQELAEPTQAIRASSGTTTMLVTALLIQDVIAYLGGFGAPLSLNQMLRYPFSNLGGIPVGDLC